MGNNKRNKLIPKPLAWIFIIGFNILVATMVSLFIFIFVVNDGEKEIEMALSYNDNQEISKIDGEIKNTSLNTIKSERKEANILEDKDKGREDIYLAIREGLLKGKTSIDISEYSESKSSKEVFKIIDEIVKGTPEILYYNGAEYWSNGILNLKYSKDRNTILKHSKELELKKIKVIKSVIKNEMTDYEKEKAIHDYIINNSKYDSINLNNNTLPPESYTAYGILIKGIGVCEGYAKTMKLFMDELGISSEIVTGRGNGENHAWNLVEIDGDYYHVDLTWNDPVMKDNSDVLRYDYFNLTNSEMKKEHSWNTNEYPLGVKTRYNYHAYNNLTVNNYNEFYNKIKESLENNEAKIELKVLNYDKEKYNLYETIEKIVRNNSKVRINGFDYSVNDKLGIFNINFN